MKKLFFACDHGGKKMKDALLDYIASFSYDVCDVGCFSDESVDYPDYAYAMAEKMFQEKNAMGIALCTSGIGMSIALNRFSHIRAALCSNACEAELTRMHNDANILVLGAGIIGQTHAQSIVSCFLRTSFHNEERHMRRVAKLTTTLTFSS